MKKDYYVYILSNKYHTTLYTGVTNDIVRRVCQHAESNTKTFAGRYNLTKLLYYETHGDIKQAIAREKQIKAGSRKKKVDLIMSVNPGWIDLSEEV